MSSVAVVQPGIADQPDAVLQMYAAVQVGGAVAQPVEEPKRKSTHNRWLRYTLPTRAALTCPYGHPAVPSIAVGCAHDECEQNLVVWPAWFKHTARHQTFINGLRFLALLAALGLGCFGLRWPVGVVTVLLAFLFVSVLLREHQWAEQRTLIGGAVVLGMLYVMRAPQASGLNDLVVSLVVPMAMTAGFIHLAMARRTAHKLRYFPWFVTLAAAIGGAFTLDMIARIHAIALPSFAGSVSPAEIFQSLLKLGLTSLAGGVLVGGVLAGRSHRFRTSLKPTAVAPRLLRMWILPRPNRSNTAARMPRALRPFARAMDRVAYIVAVACRSTSMGICNALITSTNKLIERIVKSYNALATQVRRFARRVAAVGIETVALVVVGLEETRVVGAAFVRYYVLTFAGLIVLGLAVLGIQDGFGGYVGSGNLLALAAILGNLVLLVVGIAFVVAVQTRTSILVTLDAVVRGLMEPMIGGLLFFILLSVGLAASNAFLARNPYAIGPATIAAILLVVGGFGLQMVNARRQGGARPDEFKSLPVRGMAVRLHLAPVTAAAMFVFLGVVSLVGGAA